MAFEGRISRAVGKARNSAQGLLMAGTLLQTAEAPSSWGLPVTEAALLSVAGTSSIWLLSLNYLKLKTQSLCLTSHISGVQKPHVAGSYHTGQHR